jgi:radical SAM protein with 4Fe4S-binding SPASM domain
MTPKEVIIETSDVCNLKCKFCPTLTGEGHGFMDFETFKGLVDRIDFPCTVLPWFLGEPTMNKELGDMMRYMNEKGQRYYLTTNGTIWHNEAFDAMLGPDSTAYQIIFSLDGLFPETAEAARPGTKFSKVEDNILTFMYKKNALKSKIDIGIKLCHRGQDWEEIEHFIQTWLLHEEIDFVAVGKALTEINDVSMRQFYCRYLDNFMVIRMNGDLVPCCYHSGAINDRLLPLGNVFDSDKPLSGIYNSDSYERLREGHRTRDYPEPCDKCGFAYTGSGYRGEITFRDGGGKYFMHQDFYNTFYSKSPPKKSDEEYIRRV